MARTADSTSSTDERRAPRPAERVSVGRIAGAHGLKGEVRVRVEGGDPEALATANRLWLAADGETEAGAAYDVVQVREGRPGECRVRLEGVADRDAAQALRGHVVWLSAQDLPPLEPDEYYAYELVGCAVADAAGDAIGEVVRILETGAQDLLVVTTPEGDEHLVPMAEPILQSVDVAARSVVIDPPPGLLDAPTRRS